MPSPELTTPSVPVVLIEDIRLLRDRIAGVLRNEGLTVATADDSAEAVRCVQRHHAAVVLLDPAMGSREALALTRAVRSSEPESRVVVIHLHPAEDVVAFVQAGASGFLLKDATTADYVNTIRSVAGGDAILPPRLARNVFTYLANGATSRSASDGRSRLTRREAQVAELIAEGLSNKEIAARLDLAVHTVKSHVHNVLEKLRMRSRLQIAAAARDAGLTHGVT